MKSPVDLLKQLGWRARRRPRQSPTDNPGQGLRAGVSVSGLFDELHERKASYVVLRWFDGLPHGDPDGDIDMLVADVDMARIADLFEHNPDAVQCDVYSVSGLPGSRYYGMPYLPPEKAALVLTRPTLFKDTCMVPSAEDHFLTLAYHTIYQKGLRSGLPTSQLGMAPRAAPRHDYVGTLRTLAHTSGIEVEISLESLDDYLRMRGWRPSPEVISKLAVHNGWLAARIGQSLA